MYYSYKTFLASLVILVVQSWTPCSVTSTSILSNVTDLHSLLAFKASIEFDPENILANNWTSDTNFCDWYGVFCSARRQRVVALNLPSMGLVGTISPQIGNLSLLRYLKLRNNSFHGQVISELSRLRRLEQLHLDFNSFSGEIPPSLAMCQNLFLIGMDFNLLSGTLPNNLSTLPSLMFLYVGDNKLTGTISFVNMSLIQELGLQHNEFHGDLPNDIGRQLPRLIMLALSENHFSGIIPPSLFNISSLEVISLAINSFNGDLPKDSSLQLPKLSRLFVGGNQLTGSIPSYWFNMSRLTSLGIEYNNFTGALSASLPLSLQFLNANNCNLQDEIPNEIGNLKNLTYLDLGWNRFSGIIPLTIKGMESMQQLYLNQNELGGPIPKEICSLRNMGMLFLGDNRFSGPIPECIRNLSRLQKFSLDYNELSSRIPQSLWSLDQLVVLGLSSNSFHGNLDQNFTTMKSLDILELSRNQLSGYLPVVSLSLQSLTYLDLSWNSFSGPIPESFENMISLISLNISNNNISGQIPKSLEALPYLKYLNLSYNKLTGKIPTGGPFVNFTSQSFIGNQELCGESISKSCPGKGLRKSRDNFFPLSYVVPIIVVVLIVSTLFCFFHKRSRNKLQQNPENPLQAQRMISYHEISRATNGFSEANFLGSGGFGSVYKGILSDGESVAVKILNLEIDGAVKSFDAECKVLRTVRHRNLIKVLSTCTNPELRALVLEFIPNGSLEKWLYSHNYCLGFLQRVSIMLDVAVAIDYLHCGLSEPVIHCDLKPGNVLLDNEMEAHVGDFGIAKILAANKNETQTSTLGTFGYIAPEYGGEGRVSTKGDAYSFGIMLLETFTRKNPTDEMFSEELSLTQWVSSSVPDGIAEVIDENLLNENIQGLSEMSLRHHLLAILDIGLGCSRNSPEERLEMKDVVTRLYKIKQQILSI